MIKLLRQVTGPSISHKQVGKINMEGWQDGFEYKFLVTGQNSTMGLLDILRCYSEMKNHHFVEVVPLFGLLRS